MVKTGEPIQYLYVGPENWLYEKSLKEILVNGGISCSCRRSLRDLENYRVRGCVCVGGDGRCGDGEDGLLQECSISSVIDMLLREKVLLL